MKDSKKKTTEQKRQEMLHMMKKEGVEFHSKIRRRAGRAASLPKQEE